MTDTELNLRFWRALAEYLGHACALFGMPASLAQRLWLSRAEHARISAFLRGCEDILRRLLFIDALALAPQPIPAREEKRRPPRDMAARYGAAFDLDNPETWRANFKLNMDRQRPAGIAASVRPSNCQRDAVAPDHIAAAASALRLEALIRGYNNRERLAAALARKLARNARAAHAYIADAPKRRRRRTQPSYVTLTDLLTYAQRAYQNHIAHALNSS